MTVHYLDSSVWLKRYFREDGSEAVHRLFLAQDLLAGSWLGAVEVSAAIARQSGARHIRDSVRSEMELQLDREWAGFLCTEAVEADFVAALVIARKDGLRGADAIHLALALRLGEQLRDAGDELILWTSDGELLKAAIKAGIAVQNPVSMRG